MPFLTRQLLCNINNIAPRARSRAARRAAVAGSFPHPSVYAPSPPRLDRFAFFAAVLSACLISTLIHRQI